MGAGGFGRVYKALRNGVQPVAVKKLQISGERQLTVAERDFIREIALLRACRDANIVQFQGAYLSPEETLLITEYMEGGNLALNIAAGRVTWWRRGRKIALDIAKGLTYLHSRRIIHFDLKVTPERERGRDSTAILLHFFTNLANPLPHLLHSLPTSCSPATARPRLPTWGWRGLPPRITSAAPWAPWPGRRRRCCGASGAQIEQIFTATGLCCGRYARERRLLGGSCGTSGCRRSAPQR